MAARDGGADSKINAAKANGKTRVGCVWPSFMNDHSARRGHHLPACHSNSESHKKEPDSVGPVEFDFVLLADANRWDRGAIAITEPLCTPYFLRRGNL